MPGHWLRSSVRRAALLGHAPENSAVECLIRLFTLGDTVPGELAFRTLGSACHGLEELGFLEAGGGELRSRFQIIPVNDGWIACDFPRRQGEDAPDFVMGIGPSSILIASLTPPLPGRVLELASGVGWLAGQPRPRRPRGHRHRHQPARARARPLQRAAQWHPRRRFPPGRGFLLRRRGNLRPDRVEPALRPIARRPHDLPRGPGKRSDLRPSRARHPRSPQP
jgi:hypothetical protein